MFIIIAAVSPLFVIKNEIGNINRICNNILSQTCNNLPSATYQHMKNYAQTYVYSYSIQNTKPTAHNDIMQIHIKSDTPPSYLHIHKPSPAPYHFLHHWTKILHEMSQTLTHLLLKYHEDDGRLLYEKIQDDS